MGGHGGRKHNNTNTGTVSEGAIESPPSLEGDSAGGPHNNNLFHAASPVVPFAVLVTEAIKNHTSVVPSKKDPPTDPPCSTTDSAVLT